MTHILSPSRCATAAIAAALATLPSAVMAQDAATTVAAPVPVATSAAPPVAPPPQIILPSTQPAPVVQPLPQPTVASAAPAEVAAPAAVRRAAPQRAVATVQRRAAPAVTTATTAITPVATAVPAATPAVPNSTPAEMAAPVPPLVSPTQPIAPAAEPSISPLELGLIGSGFAVVGLGVIVLFMRRRRVGESDGYDGDAPTTDNVRTDTTPLSPPRATVPPAVNPPLPFNPRAAVTAPGNHSADVDAGPTAANPFLTRKNRLRRAHFLDRQAQQQRDRDARLLAGQRLIQSAQRSPDRAYPQPTVAAD